MAVLLAFNEREAIDVCEPRAGLFSTNDAAVALAGINRAGFGCHSSAIGHTTFAPLAEGGAHVRLQPRLGTSTFGYTSVYLASLCDPAGHPILGIWQGSGSSTIHARWHGNEADAFPAGGLEVADFAFHWKLDATDGFLRIYRNGALIMDVAGYTLRDGSIGSIDRVRFQATGSSTSTSTGASAAPYFAQVLVSTEPTIAARVHTLPLTGFGAINEWTGAIGNINGIDLDETTLLTTDAPATVLFAKGTMAPIDTATEHVSAVILSHWSLADLASTQQALVPIARLRREEFAYAAGEPQVQELFRDPVAKVVIFEGMPLLDVENLVERTFIERLEPFIAAGSGMSRVVIDRRGHLVDDEGRLARLVLPSLPARLSALESALFRSGVRIVPDQVIALALHYDCMGAFLESDPTLVALGVRGATIVRYMLRPIPFVAEHASGDLEEISVESPVSLLASRAYHERGEEIFSLVEDLIEGRVREDQRASQVTDRTSKTN